MSSKVNVVYIEIIIIIIIIITPFGYEDPSNLRIFLFYFINMGIRVSLRAPRLIPRTLKLTIM